MTDISVSTLFRIYHAHVLHATICNFSDKMLEYTLETCYGHFQNFLSVFQQIILREVKKFVHSFFVFIILLKCFVSILICLLFHVKMYVIFFVYSVLTESLIRILTLE